MKVTRNVLRYILSCVLIPGVTWASGTVPAPSVEAPQQLGGVIIDFIDGLLPNVVYHTKTYDIKKTSDMEDGLEEKVNATFKLYTDITVNEDSLYDGWLETGWNEAWTERHLYDRINATFQSAGSSTYSLTFDGGSDSGHSVGQVLNWGQYEFKNLNQVIFRNISNETCDENVWYRFVSANLMAGGVLGANDSLVKASPGAKAGVSFTENNSILFSNIRADVQGEGNLISNVTALGGAIFTVNGTTSFTYNDGDIRFEDVEIYSSTKGDIELFNKYGFFEGAGGAIFSNGLTMDDNDGSIIFNRVGVIQEDEDLRVLTGILKGSVASGGAIYLLGDGSISDNHGDVAFTNCYAVGGNLSWGGAIHLGSIPSSFIEAITFSSGGTFSISWNKGQVMFHDNRVAVDAVPDGMEPSRALGGAVKISGGYNFELKFNRGAVSFLRNRAEIIGRSESVLNPVFEADGGAIYAGYSLASMLQASEVNIKWNENGVFFNENFASGRGGAIFGDKDSHFHFEYNDDIIEFESNTAQSGGGGAVYLAEAANLSLWNNDADVRFVGNKAGTDPTYLVGHGNDDLGGGAIHLEKGAVIAMSFNGDITFSNNEAAGHGGAIYGAENSIITIEGNREVLFSGNKAGGNGEAIYSRGRVTIVGNDSVTFTGHDAPALYMSTAAGSGTDANLVIDAKAGSVLFDNDRIYAESTDSHQLRVLFNDTHGGDITFRGSDAGVEVVKGDITMGKGRVILENGADLKADSFVCSGGSLSLLNTSSSESVVVEVSSGTINSGRLKAAGVNNIVNGTLNLNDTGGLHLTAGLVNAASVTQNDESGLSADGAAVLTLNGALNLTQNKLNLEVFVDADVASAGDGGVFSLLKLNNAAFDMNLWNTDNVSVSGDALFNDLLWNRSHNQLFYVYDEDAHLGDRIWTNKAGGAQWDYEARNWMAAGTEIDSIKYRDSSLGDNAVPFGVLFSDDCTDPADVSITADVAPRDVTVNATRDYTFVDGGGKITGSAKLLKQGTGTLTLALDNDFTGGVHVEGGTLEVLDSKALGSGAVRLEDGATLRLDNNTSITLSGTNSTILGNLEVAKGSYLELDFSDTARMHAGECQIDGTLVLTGEWFYYGNNSTGKHTHISGSGLVEMRGNGNTFIFAGPTLNNYVSDFNGTFKVSGSNNTMRFGSQGYRGAGQFIVEGAGNEILMLYGDTETLGWEEVPQNLDAWMMDGGVIALQDGGKIVAGKVVMEGGSTLIVSGAGNKLSLASETESNWYDGLYLLYDSTLDMTVGSGNALDGGAAVLNVGGWVIFGANSPDDYSDPQEGDKIYLNVRVDDAAALQADASYVLMSSVNKLDIPLEPDGETYWNDELIQVSGEILFSDLSWSEDSTKLLLNTPDAIVWRDSTGTGVWDVEGDKNWKRFTVANSDVFMHGDAVRFMDSCTSDSPVRITEEVHISDILVKADRDYTFADGGVTITGTGGILKQGSGTLSIALDNAFSGGVVLEEGTLRLQADAALGSGALSSSAGTSLVVENWASVSLASGSSVESAVEVARGATLKVGTDSIFRAESTVVDGKLIFRDGFDMGTTASLSGSGELRLAPDTDGGQFTVLRNDGFNGSLSVVGQGNILQVNEGGYNGAGTLTLATGSQLRFGGEGTANGVAINSGGRIVLTGNTTLSAPSLNMARGTALLVSGAGNDIVTPSTSEQSADRVFFASGSMLNMEVSEANALSSTGYTEAGLILHGIPSFGAITITLSAAGGIDGGNTYTLMSLAEDKGVTDITPSYWTASNWNENLIQVAGAGSFDHLEWVESAGVCKLVFHAPDIIVWSNAAKTGVWNVDSDANWSDFFSGNAETYLDSKKVYFGDECVSPAAVSIADAVSPGLIMVEAERDYTFTDGGGKISGETQLVKRGSGSLSLALNNDFTQGVELQEGTLRVQAEGALGSGSLHAAAGTSLVVENGTALDLSATTDSTLAGNVEVAQESSLKMQVDADSSYTAQNTVLNGSLELSSAADNQTAGTERLSGSGRLELVAGSGSLAFTANLNDGFTGDLIAGGEGNSIEVKHGGYEGSGTISAYAGGSISFTGEHGGVRLLDGAVLSADAESSLAAESFIFGDGAELLADTEPYTGSYGVAVFAARDGSPVSGAELIDAIAAEVVTLEGGSFLVQHSAYYSMANVGSLVFDGTNGRAITLSTDLTAEERGNATWYLLFSDVKDYSVQGNLTFAIEGVQETMQISLAAVEQDNGSQSLYLVASVPEPTTVTLSLLALAGLACRRRRR